MRTFLLFRSLFALSLLVFSASEAAAQRSARGQFDPTTGRFGQPPSRGNLTPTGPANGCETIGYTTDSVFPHFYTLPDLIDASSDLVADGHELVPIDTLTPAALSGIDRLVVGLNWPNQPRILSTEVDVIEAFVLGGGKLVFLGENNTAFHVSNVAIGGRFGIGYPNFDPGQVVLTDVNPHPITLGPFGDVAVVSSPINSPPGFGSMSSPGPHGTSLVDFTNGFSAAVVIEPNALAPGSGVVVAFSEINIFLEDYLSGDNQALWRNTFAYDGTYTLSFETEDDFLTGLVNGQALATPDEFGELVSLAGSGPNAGPAVFDSTPLGPNDPSQDRDLLVGRGNVMILQNTDVTAQTQPGIFDRPNDDQDGGVVTFTFPEPVEPRSVVLVDIDVGLQQASVVTLTDIVGRTRVFTVPPRWTEDLQSDGPPGWRSLDLTTLASQPGYLSTATAAESAGFDPRNVTRIEVRLGSSGAIDDLAFARFCGPH